MNFVSSLHGKRVNHTGMLPPIQVNSAWPSHRGQVQWVGPTSDSWDVNRHTVRCISPESVVLQCKLVSG